MEILKSIPIEPAIKAFRELIVKSFEIHENIEAIIDKEVFGIGIPFIISIEDILHICDMEQLGVTCLIVYMRALKTYNMSIGSKSKKVSSWIQVSYMKDIIKKSEIYIFQKVSVTHTKKLKKAGFE
ncbi:hypothetical protein QJS10_CPA08g00956 [Acorus calamus]|uniref:Uncharacterized protein n=1 Tax=Acorus calamus TaxID=4465 RepID=A0AAV9EAG3_ACOCL|nr:hypothetical protein QJS10_CPA08g00956 [Acorus calamus]